MRRQAAQRRGEDRGRWSGARARERRSTNAVRRARRVAAEMGLRARRLAAELGLRALMANLAGDGTASAFCQLGGEGFTPCAGKWKRRWAAGALRTAVLLLRNGRWAGCFWQGGRQIVEQAAWVSMVVRWALVESAHGPVHHLEGNLVLFRFGLRKQQRETVDGDGAGVKLTPRPWKRAATAALARPPGRPKSGARSSHPRRLPVSRSRGKKNLRAPRREFVSWCRDRH
jgi:hypothetical protein